MKQHITLQQVEELSEKGIERLKQWWKPAFGDIYYDGEGIGIVVPRAGGAMSPEVGIILVDEDWIPLPSIGQMIEFLDEHATKEEDWDIAGKERIVCPQIEADALLMEWPHNDKYELKDYLWESVKEVLEKHKELVEEDENGHDVQCSSGVGLDCDCWKLKKLNNN